MTEEKTKDRLLRVLAESRAAEGISGEALAAALGISRAGVWKAVQALREAGIAVTASAHGGYRLSDEPTVYLHAARIAAGLDDRAQKMFSVSAVDAVPSTNTALKEQALGGAPAGTVLAARQQTAGKGRLGRSFLSPAGTGLYMSVLVRPQIPVSEALYLTTGAAVACAEAIEEVTGHRFPAKIKWVNDIYCGERKVCGILTEAGVDIENQMLSYAVIGMGINLVEPEGGFPGELAQTAGAIFSAEDAEKDGNRLAAEILNRLAPMIGCPHTAELLGRYRSRSLLDGRDILVRPCGSLGGEEIPAKALYIDENAGLRVRFADGHEETLTSGEAVDGSQRPSVHTNR